MRPARADRPTALVRCVTPPRVARPSTHIAPLAQSRAELLRAAGERREQAEQRIKLRGAAEECRAVAVSVRRADSVARARLRYAESAMATESIEMRKQQYRKGKVRPVEQPCPAPRLLRVASHACMRAVTHLQVPMDTSAHADGALGQPAMRRSQSQRHMHLTPTFLW